MKRFFCSILVVTFILTGCDNHLFTQFFRNPHVVDVGSVELLKAETWYEFEINAKALNRIQKLRIIFDGSEPDKLEFFTRGADENFQGGYDVFISSKFPNQEIEIDVRVFDEDNIEYRFHASGRSSGMLFYNIEEQPLMGKVAKKVRVKSNITLNDVDITWISYTGK